MGLILFNTKDRLGHHGFYYSRLINMMLSHRIELDPTNAQATHLAQAAGVARFAYNWALGLWHDIYQLHKLDPDVAPLRCAKTMDQRSILSMSLRLISFESLSFVSMALRPWSLALREMPVERKALVPCVSAGRNRPRRSRKKTADLVKFD